MTATVAQIRAVDFVSLAFSNQKNGVRGEEMGHERSYDDEADPVVVIGARVIYLGNTARTRTPL